MAPYAGEDCGDLVEGQGLGARHVESLILVAPRIGQDPRGHAPRVLARDHAHAPVAGGPEDAALLVRQLHEKVRIEAIAQERVRHARRLDVLLRVEVRARQRKRRVRRRVQEGQVHDVAHPGGGRRVDESEVLVQAVLALGRGHHEEDVNALQRDACCERVLVRALHRDGSRQLGRARWRVREQAQGQAALGQEAGGGTSDVPGRAGDRQGREGRGLGRFVREGFGSGGVSHVASVPPALWRVRTPREVWAVGVAVDGGVIPGMLMGAKKFAQQEWILVQTAKKFALLAKKR